MMHRGLAVSAGVWLRAMETEISAAQWAYVAWKGLYLLLILQSLSSFNRLTLFSAVGAIITVFIRYVYISVMYYNNNNNNHRLTAFVPGQPGWPVPEETLCLLP